MTLVEEIGLALYVTWKNKMGQVPADCWANMDRDDREMAKLQAEAALAVIQARRRPEAKPDLIDALLARDGVWRQEEVEAEQEEEQGSCDQGPDYWGGDSDGHPSHQGDKDEVAHAGPPGRGSLR